MFGQRRTKNERDRGGTCLRMIGAARPRGHDHRAFLGPVRSAIGTTRFRSAGRVADFAYVLKSGSAILYVGEVDAREAIRVDNGGYGYGASARATRAPPVTAIGGKVFG
jgi:hypothetical protein